MRVKFLALGKMGRLLPGFKLAQQVTLRPFAAPGISNKINDSMLFVTQIVMLFYNITWIAYTILQRDPQRDVTDP